MEKKQNETKPYENPVLLVKDILAKQGKIDREMMYLISKAKYYVPKPKVNETGQSLFSNLIYIFRQSNASLPA